MLWRASDLEGYGLEATDGTIGTVKDLLFEDRDWTIRWAVIDTGGWLSSRKVLLPPSTFGEADPVTRRFPVTLTRDQVKKSPGIEFDAPVSRQSESDIYDHYGWKPYWFNPYGVTGFYVPSVAGGPLPAADAAYPPEEPAVIDPAAPPSEVTTDGQPSLRSANEVTGYRIEATDGSIGHVEDIVIESRTAKIRYLLVDTKNWWPGKVVLISPHWADQVSWGERTVYVRATRDQVKGSPEYNVAAPIDRGYEQRLHDYYEQRPYWGV